MDIIDNLKKIGKNWRLTALVIWLLLGVAIIPYPNRVVSIIGILIFLPFLVFLMFLFLLSLISKKDIFEYSPWKIILFLLISLPIMLVIFIVLIIMFAIAIITYFFFTSWFIFYGCYLIGKRLDEKLTSGGKKNRFLRFIIFFGGLAISLLLLYLFIIGPTIFDFSIILETPLAIPWYLNGIYLIVGGVLIGLTVICIIYMFKKSFNGWFGVFTILVSFYSLFLVLKIYMGIVGTGTDQDELATIWVYLGVIVPDLFIIFYSLSTLMGSQAELLSKRLKRFGMDTVIIWLILSKVTYEFIHYFPYEIFNAVNISWFPWINELSLLNDDLINMVKNVAVLGFFILMLVIIGIYEIHKYH
ncbi:MAG: hypothetical protein KAX18_12555, partial [Candidatus Lokiarchaeota archaeon]|nr:hypothetical protein [Candidatus Lokiarchaeota archaeon]